MASSRKIEKRYLPSYVLQEDEPARASQSQEHIIKWTNGENFSLEKAVAAYEKNIIKSAITNSRNLSDAANKLGISRQSLNYKLRRHSLLENDTFSKYNISE